jgi:hypothetical protein
MLAKRPMQNVVNAEMAAVAVTRSLLISWTQSMYSVLVAQKSFSQSASGQRGHVPPVSDRMVAGSVSTLNPCEYALRTVDGDDVSHGKKGREASPDFSEEVAALASFAL